MDLQLSGKRALVTGSSTVSARKLNVTREGATVVVHGRNQERASRVALEIKQNGGQAFCATLSKDEAKQVAESALSAMAGVYFG